MTIRPKIQSKVKSLDDKVMEREIEQKMRDLFPSYSGIHQPKNERQTNFHGNYSTFFVRFDNENDAKVRIQIEHRCIL